MIATMKKINSTTAKTSIVSPYFQRLQTLNLILRNNFMSSKRGLCYTPVYRYVWEQACLQQRAASPEAKVVINKQLCHLWCGTQVQMLSCPKISLPFPALKQLPHRFGKPQIFPKHKSTFFPNKRSKKMNDKRPWLYYSIMSLRAVFEPGSVSSAGRYLTKAQLPLACEVGKDCMQGTLTLYGLLSEYFGSWSCLKMYSSK